MQLSHFLVTIFCFSPKLVFSSKESLLKILNQFTSSRDLSSSFIKILNGYGCWCYFDNLNGHGPTFDNYDNFCKNLQLGYRCAILDGKLENSPCDPLTVSYNPVMMWTHTQGENALINECKNFNQNDLCAQRACILETIFIRRVLDQGVLNLSGNFSLLHSEGNFDFVEECGVRLGGGSGEVKCCGEYPNRKVYNSDYFQCCAGSLQMFC